MGVAMAVGALICRLFCKFATTNIIEQLVNLLAVTFFHIRSATVTTIILAAAVATSTRYAQVNALQCELLSAAFGLGKYPRPHSLVLVVAVAVALVTRLSARAGARAVLLFELGIKALALWEWRWQLGTDMSLFCKFAPVNITKVQLVNLLAVICFHIRSATVTAIILAAAVATSTE